MTLEELIEQTEKVAIYHDKDKMPEDTWHYTNELMKERYYQLTACLKELKAHREAWEKCIKEIKEWYWNADKQAIAKDPCVVDAMVDLFIRTIKECRPKEGDTE